MLDDLHLEVGLRWRELLRGTHESVLPQAPPPLLLPRARKFKFARALVAHEAKLVEVEVLGADILSRSVDARPGGEIAFFSFPALYLGEINDVRRSGERVHSADAPRAGIAPAVGGLFGRDRDLGPDWDGACLDQLDFAAALGNPLDLVVMIQAK